MKQYLDLLQNILQNGDVKESGRAGMPNTRGLFGVQMRFNLKDGFPLLTTKKMPFKLIAHELIWFLRGDTNIKYLVDNGCNIWNGDAYRHYKNMCKAGFIPVEEHEFIEAVKANEPSPFPVYKFGDLGDTYGAQWRRWSYFRLEDNEEAGVEYQRFHLDQIKKVIDGIKKNPYGRRHIVSAWNPSEVDNMALPPCHVLFQFNCRPIAQKERIKWWENNVNSSQVREKINFDDDHLELEQYNVPKFYLDCALTQRSCDSFLGIPFNIASYALLTEVVAKMCNMVAGTFVWTGNDTHIYDNHMEAVKEQLSREPMKLCTLKIADMVSSFKDINELSIDDLTLENYVSHPSIKAELSVGI